MSGRKIGVNQLKAVQMIRAGSASDQVCRTLRLRPDSVRTLEIAWKNVPNDVLARLEQTLNANEKLRRLIASLGRSISEVARIKSN